MDTRANEIIKAMDYLNEIDGYRVYEDETMEGMVAFRWVEDLSRGELLYPIIMMTSSGYFLFDDKNKIPYKFKLNDY